MAEKAVFILEKNNEIAHNVFSMWLSGPTHSLTMPGQFVNIALSGLYLRRPISVCRWSESGLELIYKIVGGGTRQMAGLLPGARLDVLVGLGNGFDLSACAGKKVLLAGGGVGAPPLYALAEALAKNGSPPIVTLGFGTVADVILTEEFAKLGCEVILATEDGSVGIKGYVTQAMAGADYDYYCACGPLPMLRAVYGFCEEHHIQGQLSMENRMGCGFGACMGCSCKTKTGSKRVCLGGPVFTSQEILFEEKGGRP